MTQIIRRKVRWGRIIAITALAMISLVALFPF